MLKTKVEVEEDQGAPAITPDLLSKLKKQDMRQAVVERFSDRAKKPRHRAPPSLRGSGSPIGNAPALGVIADHARKPQQLLIENPERTLI